MGRNWVLVFGTPFSLLPLTDILFLLGLISGPSLPSLGQPELCPCSYVQAIFPPSLSSPIGGTLEITGTSLQ